MAKRATGFDMKILYHNRNRKEVEEKKLGELMLYLQFTDLFTIDLKTILLLTEREGHTREYWPKVVAVPIEHSEVRTKND